MRGSLLLACLVCAAQASVLQNLASVLLPERHVVYQHLVSTTGRAYTDVAELKPSAHSAGWASHLVDPTWNRKGFQIGQKSFGTGIYVHSPSSVEYHTGSRYSVFSGCAGVDDRKHAAEQCGDDVEFHVVTDNGSGKKTAWSAMRKAGDAASCFSVPMLNVRKLELVVTKAQGAACDRAEWVDMKLYEDPAIDCRRIASLVPDPRSVGWVDPLLKKGQQSQIKFARSWPRDGFRVGGQRFTNGVFATTNSKIIIPLHGKYDSFTACAGVDDINGDCGSGATFRAALDGTQHWSKKLSNGAKAECFSFTTKGALELELSVASNMPGCKKADWVNGQLCSIVKRVPIDCQVTPYGKFTACSKSCGTGYRTHTRTVLKPAANGGQACPALFETVQCNTVDCPVDCTVGKWGSWSPCSVSCGGGTRSRSRQETRAAVFGGAACPPMRHETGCAPQHCPVDCKIAQWSAWGACSQPCGGGTRTRTRDLTQPRYGGRVCVKGSETEECNIQLCKKDCKVTSWGQWSQCSASCGTGFQHRSRTQSQKAQMGGKHCPGLHDTRSCNVAACPIDCELGPWTAYDECNRKCGGGTQKRRRSIHVDAAYGGAACGALTSTRVCNEHCCAGRELIHGKCRDCNVGSFQPSHAAPQLGGAPKCTMCPAGQHQNMPGKAFCLPCPAGRHAFAKGFGVCEACPAGKTALEGKVECFNCPAGKYSDKGWSFCAECPHGKVAITNVRDITNNFVAPAAKACTDCPTGKFARSKGTLCAECDQGKFHPKGFSPQLYKVWTDPSGAMAPPNCAGFAPCDPGMELTSSGPESSGSCTPCKHGFYKANAGTWSTQCSRCQGCPAGQMRVGCNSSSAGKCVACSAGTFKETGVEVGAFDTKCTAFSACPAGQFLAAASATSQGQCRSCPASTFKVAKGTWQTQCTSCQKCDKGQFLEKCGGSNGGYCMGCPSGKFQQHKAQATCESCATGHYSRQSDADRLAYRGPTACSACNKGKFAAMPGSGSCDTCPHGRYNNQAGRSDCFGECATGCVSGSYRKGCTAHNAGKCTKCPQGTYTVPYHFGCIDKNACMTGDFATSTGCRQCPGGKFKDTIGHQGCTSCKSCPEGQERVGCGDNNPGTCSACGVGKFKGGASDASCAACPAGRFAAKSGSFECHACQKGQYQDDTGKTECEMCSPGQVASEGGQVACQECARGKYSGIYGGSACTNCAAGRFAANTGAQHAALCGKCPPGHFQPSAGQAACHACQVGTHTSTYGATSAAACIKCAGGRYSGTGAGTCTQCAAGRKGTSHNQCGDCPTGRFQQFSGATACERCASGRFAPRDGHSDCVDCAILLSAPGGDPRVGDKVRARYQGSTRHFVGSIVKANGGANTYDVKFDDGKRDRTVPANDISTHFYWTEGEAGASKCTMHPVDCQVSAWVDEGACSKSCGGGKQRQRRRVTRPEWGNGVPCSTYPLTALKPCNTQACPVDCVPGAWGSWSKCTNPCGGGTQQRERPVAQAAQHGGKACSAMTEDLRCNEHKCQARDCSHVKCLMKQVTVNGMAVTMPIVFHHKLEHNGWHHTCGYDPTHADDCRCICKHTVEEFDPMHVKRLGGRKVKKMLMANAAA